MVRSSSRIATPRNAALALAVGFILSLAPVVQAAGGRAEPLTVPAGRSVVLEMPSEVSTVSIADSKVADAAVGSERSVVLNGKLPGKTSLVVWEENGRFTLYDVTVVDQSQRRQVLLQCKVSEVNLSKLKEIGIDWTGALRSLKSLDGAISGGLFVTKVETPFTSPIVGPETDGFFTYRRSDGSATFLSTFKMLEEKGAVKTIASPNLVATSGDSASFLAGGEFPVPIARAGSESGFSVTIEWKEYGVRLKFIPTVLDGNRIRLLVSPEVSAPDYARAVLLNGYIIPALVTRRVTTTVELGSGEVLVIGGVKHVEDTKTVKKVPILGDIPLLKLLFSSKKTERLERDLMVVVTPSLITQVATTFPSLPTDESNGQPMREPSNHKVQPEGR